MLASKDQEIIDLENQVRANDGELMGFYSVTTTFAPGGVKTVDQLIAQYKARIAERDDRIAMLKQKLKEQKNYMTAAGIGAAAKAPLKTMGEKMNKLTGLIDQARNKRDTIAKEGKLDPELNAVLGRLVNQEEVLTHTLGKLGAIEDKVETSRSKIEEKRQALVKKFGDNVGEIEHGLKSVAEKTDLYEIEMLKVAEDFGRALLNVQADTKELETGVHPHGAKWWRYRYEHAYVEAFMLIFVCILMLIWDGVYRNLRRRMYAMSMAKEMDTVLHGTMYVSWLEFMAGELMVSLLSYMTVWTLAKIGVFDCLPFVLISTDHMHLPSSGLEYEYLALDICVVLFFAIVFYYLLMLAVVIWTTAKLHSWVVREVYHKKKTHSAPGTPASEAMTPRSRALAEAESEHMKQNLAISNMRRTMTVISKLDVEDYHKIKKYFLQEVKKDQELLNVLVGSPQETAEKMTPEEALEAFPFWIYLRLSVRSLVDELFMFGFKLWLCIIATFIMFCFLHRFLFVGYIRIMIVYGVVLIGVLLYVVYDVRKINGYLHDYMAGRFDSPQHTKSNKGYATETLLMSSLRYLLFFLCYGAARVICQPWMWRLHFYPVLWITISTVIITITFMLYVAPMIPTFAFVMSLPPYLTKENAMVMKQAIDHDEIRPEDTILERFTPDTRSEGSPAPSARSLGRVSVSGAGTARSSTAR